MFLSAALLAFPALAANARSPAGAALLEAVLPPPAYTGFQHSAELVSRHAWPECDVEIYRQANGPGSSQRVVVALPKSAEGRLPAVVVPYYFPDPLLGFVPETHSPLPPDEQKAFSGEPQLMAELVSRGYVCISCDAFHLTYPSVQAALPRISWDRWKEAGEGVARDWPGWTGIGKMAFDASLLVEFARSHPRVDSARIALAGHSLGGKIAFYAGCLDGGRRVRAMLLSDFGFRWDRSNWGDVHYYGAALARVQAAGATHADLLAHANGLPLCLLAGEYDDESSFAAIRGVAAYAGAPEGRLLLVNHASGHRPPPSARERGYGFLARALGSDSRQRP